MSEEGGREEANGEEGEEIKPEPSTELVEQAGPDTNNEQNAPEDSKSQVNEEDKTDEIVKEEKALSGENEGLTGEQPESREAGSDERTEKDDTFQPPVEEKPGGSDSSREEPVSSDKTNEKSDYSTTGNLQPSSPENTDAQLEVTGTVVVGLDESGTADEKADGSGTVDMKPDSLDTSEEENKILAISDNAFVNDVRMSFIGSVDHAPQSIPPTPKHSSYSYDGDRHEQHKEADTMEVKTALESLAQAHAEGETADGISEQLSGIAQNEGVPGPAEPASAQNAQEMEKGGASEPKKTRRISTKPQLTFRARAYDEKKTIAAMRQGPPRHEFVGYVFSSETPRPHGITNFFLPIVPQPPPRMHICINGANALNEVLSKTMKPIPRGLLPLSSVRLSWAASPHRTVYTLQSLYAYLTRFGPIEGLYRRGPNAALAIFYDLTSAAACVKSPYLGLPWDHIVATWWEPRLQNVGYLCRQIREEDYNNGLAEMAVNVPMAANVPMSGGATTDMPQNEEATATS